MLAQVNPAERQARLHSIDFLRGVAVLTVAIGHSLVAPRWTSIDVGWFRALCGVFTAYGGLGVPLFFVISGFCIHLGYARHARQVGTPDFRFVAFWRRRMWRLYPTYFVVLCCTMLMVVVLYWTHPAAPALVIYPEPKPRWMLGDFFAHVFMLHGFFPVFDMGAGNPPFWTLAREEYLYVLYPVLLLLRKRLGPLFAGAFIFWLGVGIGPLILAWHVPVQSLAVIWASVLPVWILWYLGAVAAEAHCGLIRLPRLLQTIWMVPLWALFAERWHAVYVFGWGMAFFTLINTCAHRERSGRWTDRGVLRAVAAVGTMSYSLYLVHDPVETAILSLSLRFGAFATAGAYLLRSAVMVLASLVIAKLLFVSFESRFLFGHREKPALPIGDEALDRDGHAVSPA
jgi:peptidoglycan/LPS O-acetylase OafA/YrhL